MQWVHLAGAPGQLCTRFSAQWQDSKSFTSSGLRNLLNTTSSGYLIYNMFLGLDSDQYPLKTYGDLAFRLYGPIVRHGFNFLQSLQLLCNVGVIIVGNGQGLSQVSKFRLCYGKYFEPKCHIDLYSTDLPCFKPTTSIYELTATSGLH